LAEAPEGPLYVTEAEIAAEEASLAEKEARLSQLESERFRLLEASAEKEARISALEASWSAFVEAHPDRLLVSALEWRRETRSILDLTIRLRYTLWPRWSSFMRSRANALREASYAREALRDPALARSWARRAAAYLGLVRDTLGEIRAAEKQLAAETERRELKVIVPRELAGARREAARLRSEVEQARARIEETIEETARLEEEIEAERERISRKVVVVEELLGDESCSGYRIYWRPREEDYAVRKPAPEGEIGELVRTEKRIAVAVTYSLSTEVGHDVPLELEIMCVTYMAGMGKSEIEAAVAKDGPIELGLKKWLLEQGWAPELMDAVEKIGVEYNGEKHVDARALYDFTVPDWGMVHVVVERRSRYIPERRYEGEFMA